MQKNELVKDTYEETYEKHVKLERKQRGKLYRFFNKLCKSPYFLAGPACILSLCFTVFPILYGFGVSFCNWNTLKGTIRFVWFENYSYIFSNPEFWTILKNTLVLAVAFVGISLVVGVLLGSFLNRDTSGRNLISTVMFTPHIISTVSIAVVFLWLMDPEAGLFNAILELLGMQPSGWIYDSSTSLGSIIFVMIWKYAGYTVLIVISGLRAIPNHVYEAARLDKSSPIKTMMRITLPLLSPTIFFLLITLTTEAFCAFDVIQLMTRGGPDNASNTLAYYIYQTGFQFMRIGEAMAVAMVLFAIVAGISVLNTKVFSKKIHY